MRLLFIGDIVGSTGRGLLKEHLFSLRKDLKLDCVVANAENAAGGNGITLSIAKELQEAGVDAITLGDHVWDQKGFDSYIDNLDFVCRPANLLPNNPGRPYLILQIREHKVGILTVLGNQFLKIPAGCPFSKADEILKEFEKHACSFKVVEIHAEATSEKVALGWHLDGRVNAVFGTHTHIPTADNRLLNKGTAYQTDLGMTGPYESILGREIDPVLNYFLTGRPSKWVMAKRDLHICGALIECDPKTGKTVSSRAFIYPEWGT